MASCPTCNFCQKRTHTDALCVLNPGSQNFKKDLVCQTCGVRGHSSKVCNEAIRAAVKNTGNKPFPNYSVEIAEMLGEEVEDMRIRLPLVVNDLCAEVMYDTGATHSHCDEVRWIAAHDSNPLYFSALYLAMTVATLRAQLFPLSLYAHFSLSVKFMNIIL